MKHQQSSHYLDLGSYQLHVRRLLPFQPANAPALMLHGAIENGRIFYSASGKGLGSYLADNGFMVYCPDFAGRGLSKPHVSEGFTQSQQQMITQDIPALINYVFALHQQPVVLVAHSWGGVLAAACLARFPELAAKVAVKVCFGSKRVISVQSLERKLKIDLVWNIIAPWLGRKYGYFPARKWRMGNDDEPYQFLQDTVCWIKGDSYQDISDHFDYAHASKQLNWPPVWHFAAQNDRLLGHPDDVKAFIAETSQQARFTLLAKDAGYLQDYDHISMLTHPNAVDDHFVELRDWLLQLSQ
ncbi:alpha/beta hydrolase [Rheinheimera baltica]|uniref:Alpha/beta hydrolase n=1 Tax=Rheinheimera baltica TaxID=67576 RepID=A0ABT9I2X6_9GAMM|nr:alpha/beta hydrolase [Rheinheimera baltica]MDP5137523.1 alpha/beta hydrolase [Rheinheimera baltica]MDP5143273.1 alpha/beta hydrolase [Rheinheimera baltica]MDP5150011.1 alpha/beta hydrolase [Rheinheimera baltica]